MSFNSLPPTQTLEISNDLSLIPRISLLLTIHRSDLSVKPFDEWQFKHSLINFLKNKTSLSISHTIPEDDINIHTYKDLKKRKRDEPVATGTLYIRDLEFLNEKTKRDMLVVGGDEEEVGVVEKRFLEWRKGFVEKVDGINLNLEGVKFRLNAVLNANDDFDGLKKSWEEFYAFGNRGYSSRGGKQQPDTIVIKGVPSRWFAEPRVSSKPSMLVTHTIFSIFGKIRNLNVAVDDYRSKTEENGSEDIFSGLHCKIVVQFEKHTDFCNALKILCGHSMQKRGSRLRADYKVTWERDELFQNTQQMSTRLSIQEKGSRWQTTEQYRNEAPRLQSHASNFSSSDPHSRRFKD